MTKWLFMRDRCGRTGRTGNLPSLRKRMNEGHRSSEFREVAWRLKDDGFIAYMIRKSFRLKLTLQAYKTRLIISVI